MRSTAAFPIIFGVVLFVSISSLFFDHTEAQTREELERDIAKNNEYIAALDKEIAEYERQLTHLGSQKQTLQNTIKGLEIQQKQLQAKIRATKNKIGALELQIVELNKDIGTKETLIQNGKAALGASIRSIERGDEQSVVEAILGSGTVSSLWKDIEVSEQVQRAVRSNIADLKQTKESLTASRTESEEKREELSAEKKKLTAQEQSLAIMVREQKSLLAQTREKESAFQDLLEEKRMAKIAFENALLALESQLEYAYDPTAVPRPSAGVLRWPLDNVKVTQYFGNTQFALAGAYNGKGHNGIDLRASIGTPVRATLSGTVEGTGNTDTIRKCYSYGKWVLIRHNNGLSTLYAHLSEISVNPGDSVSTGSVIGYSGFTGYATGPHLHFAVYASNGVVIKRLADATGKSTPCANAVIPVAPLGAYLNPINYLN